MAPPGLVSGISLWHNLFLYATYVNEGQLTELVTSLLSSVDYLIARLNGYELHDRVRSAFMCDSFISSCLLTAV